MPPNTEPHNDRCASLLGQGCDCRSPWPDDDPPGSVPPGQQDRLQGSAAPIRCDDGKTAMESCLRCDPLNLLLWGRLPLATTLHLRERFRAYRDKPGASDGT